MNVTANFTITSLERQHLQAVDDLLFLNQRVHTHMDWYEPLDWLAQFEAPVKLAWQGRRLVGLLAASSPVNSASWLRLAALHDRISADQVFAPLWCDLSQALLERGCNQVHVLIAQPWIKHHLRGSGFHFVEDVVTLQRNGSYVPAAAPDDIIIRLAQPDDLLSIARVDDAAFSPPWQMTESELWQAQRVAAICTVATHEQQIVGYQISTLYSDDAHLARLAVAPQQQGRGIGALLVDDLLHRFSRRHVATMTVNTQISNLRSQRLYRRFGFYRNGYDLPVWSAMLSQ